MSERLTAEEIETLRAWRTEEVTSLQYSTQLRVVDYMLRLHNENQKLKTAIQNAISHANGRQSEWGERAEIAFDYLFRVVNLF